MITLNDIQEIKRNLQQLPKGPDNILTTTDIHPASNQNPSNLILWKKTYDKAVQVILKNKLFNEFYLFKSDVKLMNKGSNNVSALLKKLPNFFKKIKTLETFSNKDKIVNFL